MAFDEKHKISEKFEDQEYEVITQPHTDILVFKIRAPNGRERTLHRNNLLALGNLSNDEDKTNEGLHCLDNSKGNTLHTEDTAAKINYVSEKNTLTIKEDSDSEDSETEILHIHFDIFMRNLRRLSL